MAVAWQATGTLIGSTGADITPVIPTHAADDILVLHAWARSNAVTLTTPSGWTPIAGPIDQSTTMRNYWYRPLLQGDRGGRVGPLALPVDRDRGSGRTGRKRLLCRTSGYLDADHHIGETQETPHV